MEWGWPTEPSDRLSCDQQSTSRQSALSLAFLPLVQIHKELARGREPPYSLSSSVIEFIPVGNIWDSREYASESPKEVDIKVFITNTLCIND